MVSHDYSSPTTFHWSKLCHMTTSHCKEGWELIFVWVNHVPVESQKFYSWGGRGWERKPAASSMDSVFLKSENLESEVPHANVHPAL